MNKIFKIFLIAILFAAFNTAYANTIVKDEFVEETLGGKTFTKPEANLEYNYEDTDRVEIPLHITEKISTAGKYATQEGKRVEFTVAENVYYKGKLIIPEGTKVSAKIEILTTKGISGIPGEIFLSDFEIPGIKSSQLLEPISKRGQNRTLWILPLKWALTPLPPLGSFTNIIFGGDGVIKPKHTLKLYYYPNWI